MKRGDLVRLPRDDYQWWSEKIGIVTGTKLGHGLPRAITYIDGHSFEILARRLEMVNEAR